MSYILLLEGQEIPLAEEVAATDETIRNCILPFYPEAATAQIKREEVNGVTQIRMVKSAGTKGCNVLQNLLATEDSLNPALALSWQLKQVESQGNLDIETAIKLQPQINSAIATGSNWETEIETSLNQLKSSKPASSKILIVSF